MLSSKLISESLNYAPISSMTALAALTIKYNSQGIVRALLLAVLPVYSYIVQSLFTDLVAAQVVLMLAVPGLFATRETLEKLLRSDDSQQQFVNGALSYLKYANLTVAEFMEKFDPPANELRLILSSPYVYLQDDRLQVSNEFPVA